MNTVQTDYAFLMLKMEQYQKAMHNACLRKNWKEALDHAMKIDSYCKALMDWLDEQQEGLDGKFQEVRMPQQETV
jgi:hypothetical protein